MISELGYNIDKYWSATLTQKSKWVKLQLWVKVYFFFSFKDPFQCTSKSNYQNFHGGPVVKT